MQVLQPPNTSVEVWAVPRSLATTCGITIVFSSSRYLDVSVPWVVSLIAQSTWSSTTQVYPFGHLRIKARLQLPVAYRSLPRPSSSPEAKAFPIRSYLLPSSSHHRFLLTLLSIICISSALKFNFFPSIQRTFIRHSYIILPRRMLCYY